ncbi:MAG: putative Ig domain-containing protein, partial [Gemmatimonadales bacterium]
MTQRLHPLRGAAWLTMAWLVASCGGDGPTRPSSTVASVSLSAVGSTTLSIGQTVQLRAQAKNAAGQLIPGVTFGWTSESPNVAQVSPTGLVTAISAGTAVIRASTGDRSAQVTVTVVQPPPPAGPSVLIDNWYLRVGIVGTPYPGGIGVVGSGGDGVSFAYEVVAGELPPGIALGAASGLLSGTPTTSGTFFFEVRVTSAGQTASRVFALSVSTKPVDGYNIAIVNASGMMPSATNRAALDG